MRIRIRGPSGASTLNLAEDSTVGDLRLQISEKTLLAKFDIKYGYPPKPLHLKADDALLSSLDVRLDGEQLTVGSQEAPSATESVGGVTGAEHAVTPSTTSLPNPVPASVSFAGMAGVKHGETSGDLNARPGKLVSLKRKPLDWDVPEQPLPERGATLVLRVMPDDNSCLFRAFAAAVLPGDDFMLELRSLVAVSIQEQPDIYTQVVLEQSPEEYCKWIQTDDAWGGAIELKILSLHFDIEVCSIDVQSLRVDRYNEGRPTRCIIVYSGIHYDIIVQCPSPYTADYSPELDKRVWDSDDNEVLEHAIELCKKLQARHYYTDTGGMAIRCNECGWVGNGEVQASGHAQQMKHYDMAEVGAQTTG